MIRFLAAPLVALALAGCAETLKEAPPVDPTGVCQSYSSALATISTLIEADVIDAQGDIADRVADVVVVVAPICEADTAPATNSAAMQRLLDGVGNLLQAQTDAITAATEE